MFGIKFAHSFFVKQQYLRIHSKNAQERAVQAITFDLAGTLVDRYTNSVVSTIRKAIGQVYPRLVLSDSEIRSHMGLKKMDHLKQLFNLQTVRQKSGSYPTQTQLDTIHSKLESLQIDYYLKHPKSSELLPFVTKSLEQIKTINPKIRFCVTTGFPRSILDVIKNNIHDSNNLYYTNYFNQMVASDEVKNGRPSPSMILKAIRVNPLFYKKYPMCLPIINLGDTVHDVQSGINAGAISGAVLRYSSTLKHHQMKDPKTSTNTNTSLSFLLAMEKTRQDMLDAGADFVIDDFRALPQVVRMLEES